MRTHRAEEWRGGFREWRSRVGVGVLQGPFGVLWRWVASPSTSSLKRLEEQDRQAILAVLKGARGGLTLEEIRERLDRPISPGRVENLLNEPMRRGVVTPWGHRECGASGRWMELIYWHKSRFLQMKRG
ncbi:MAG: hypothetical protein HQL51_04025 [Magnetococcales bacterium]|nr:hypothetical protein [Magnetococcales bacterium]